MTQTIELTIDPAGHITLQTKGIMGTACQAVSRTLERELGLRTAERLTTEYFQTVESEAQQIRQD
jgi:hypothetical protein